MHPCDHCTVQHVSSNPQTNVMNGSDMHVVGSRGGPTVQGSQLPPLLVDMLLPVPQPMSQSFGQDAQVSPASHVPSPHTPLQEQSAGHV